MDKSMTRPVQGAVAFVTGANRGIGLALVDELRRAGAARIYAGARNTESLADIVARDPERIVPIQLDVTDERSIANAVTQAPDVTLLINNAGVIFPGGFIAAPDLTGARMELEVNFFGMLAMCRAFAPVLGQNGGGAIVNMLSILGRVCAPATGAYSASKAAALMMTQGVRAELAGQGTLVVGVMPGFVDTDMTANVSAPKMSPAEVASLTIQAVENGEEDVYPGQQASSLAALLLTDTKAVEKQLAGMLPRK